MSDIEIKLAKLNGVDDLVMNSEIDKLVRQKYTISNELAILRQKDSKPEEFEEYNTYVEQCKATVKDMFARVTIDITEEVE